MANDRRKERKAEIACVRKEGSEAALEGNPFYTNPYPQGSPNYLQWCKGYMAEVRESKEEISNGKIVRVDSIRVGPESASRWSSLVSPHQYVEWIRQGMEKVPPEYKSIATLTFRVDCDDLFGDQEIVCHAIYMDLEYYTGTPR